MPCLTEPEARRPHAELMASPTSHVPEPAMFTIGGATAYSGFTRSRLYEEISAGNIEARKAGRRTLIVGDSLRSYLTTLPRADIRLGRKAA